MIHVRGLHKRYGSDSGGVRGVSLDIGEGAFFCLVGPSGCGKTTTLRCIAGLEKPDQGEIEIGDTTVFSSTRRINIPAHRRNVGMVFQSYAIWPHMTVYQNVAYPLKTRHLSRAEIRDRAMWALELVGLQDKAARPAPLLSGGEQQRVAFARAVVDRSKVLLLDEPLSNLDAKLRQQMRAELRELQRRIGFTALYVTHDQDEAFALSDEMAVMDAGTLMERGAPDNLYRRPTTAFGAEFLGTVTSLPGRVVETVGEGRARVDTSLGVVECAVAGLVSTGTRVRVYVRPEDVEVVDPDEGPSTLRLNARVVRVTMLGGLIDWVAEVNGTRLQARSLATLPAVAKLRGLGQDGQIEIRVTPSSALPLEAQE